MLTSVALDKAADYMDEHGWTQGQLRNDRGEVCVRGALVFGNHVPVDWFGLEDILCTEIQERTGYLALGAITVWNDMMCPSKEEAVHMLRMAAKRAESEGC